MHERAHGAEGDLSNVLDGSDTRRGFHLEPESLRLLGYQVMDEVADYLQGVSERPVWQPLPESVRTALSTQPLPEQGTAFEETLALLKTLILPYPQGNGHPRFAGWITSAPAPTSVLLTPLAAAFNANCGIGDHAGQVLERCVVRWLMALCGFPTEGSAGVLVSGGSEANLTCLLAARAWAATQDGWNIREEGVQAGLHTGKHPPFVLYQSDQGHFSLRRAVEIMGLGRAALHVVASTPSYQIDVGELAQRIRLDRAAGLRPFCVAATVGTVETGAIDPLEELADLCQREGLWLHVDGAYGAFGSLAPSVAPRYKGMERVDSLATDQHKWLSVPIDCGCALVRDSKVLHDTFRLSARTPAEGPGAREELCERQTEGQTEGQIDEQHWLSEYTLQRTRRFRALDVWAVIRSAGRAGLSAAITRNIELARLLAYLIEDSAELELVCAGPLSIVRFRAVPWELRDQPVSLDRFNTALATTIQQRGKAFVTSTRLQGREVLRACLVHAMTTEADVRSIVEEVQTCLTLVLHGQGKEGV